ncbi:putative gustatory receptor 28b [Vespula squamosa]|uniref:Gustatory receptor 28b n=1 Tax=Vespula squamosa TaxID=30214 RepID=A0ABD2B0J0_VESSQ
MKFSQLNDLLRSMLTTTIDSPQHKRILRSRNIKKYDPPSNDIRRTYKLDDDVMKIKKTREIHLELIKCARNINDAYGLHILFSISTSLILITITSYNMYCFVMTTDYSTELYRISIYTNWIFHFTMKIVIQRLKEINIDVVSHFLLHASNIGDILCELYEPSTSNEFRTEIRDFTLQVIQNPLIFTTNGFFDLDYTLMHSMIGAVASYLIILIQVRNISGQVLIENSTLSTNNYTEN